MMLSKGYMDTARTLHRVAGSMTDEAIVERLKALAQDYERRAEKVSETSPAQGLHRRAAHGQREASIAGKGRFNREQMD